MNTATQRHPDVPLDQPLPPDMVVGLTWRPFRYRRYPVFSWAWWRGRGITSLGFILIYSGLGVVGSLASGKSIVQVCTVCGYFVVGAMLMVNLGPALATALRMFSAPTRPRGWCMVLLAVLGSFIALFADAWASSEIGERLGEKDIPDSERRISSVDESALSLFRISEVFVYFALGGGLATLAYFSELRRWAARTELLKQQSASMRLNVLQAQIEPHFVFNTLAAIRPLLKQDADKAERALDALAAHLRAVLPSTSDQQEGTESTLGKQLDICASGWAVG
jgi:hypothetical protein